MSDKFDSPMTPISPMTGGGSLGGGTKFESPLEVMGPTPGFGGVGGNVVDHDTHPPFTKPRASGGIPVVFYDSMKGKVPPNQPPEDLGGNLNIKA